jgi:DNA-binding LacI/PurR family transcriptional regulator
MTSSGKTRSARRHAPAQLPKAARTLKDVARAMGVSRTTVSNAFNRPEQLSERLREEILSKARNLGYFGPDLRARAMRRRELREVGVVFHHDLSYAMSDASSIEFLRGVSKELDERHLTLQVIPKMGRKLMLAAAFQTTADVLIVHAEIGPEFVPEITAAQKPVVLVDSLVPGIPSVRTDDRHGASLAMQHALAARPEFVVVLCFLITDAERARVLSQKQPARSGYVGSERVAGYALAARASGFPAERLLWVDVDDQWPETAGERMVQIRSRLPAGARIAIVAMSDRLALAAQHAVKSWRSHKVVSIVGFDDNPAARAAGLTTIRQDHFLKGQLCVKVVLDGVKPRVLPVHLVVRDT